jgi:hypothetical protein
MAERTTTQGPSLFTSMDTSSIRFADPIDVPPNFKTIICNILNISAKKHQNIPE